MNFNSKTVSKITGLSFRRIDYWDSTHFIKPSISEASGYGSVRLYSFNDLIQLKVAKTLMDMGISLQKIRKAINYLKKNMPVADSTQREVEKPLSELKFLTDSENVFVLTTDKKTIIDTLKNGQVVFSIAIGEIVESLKGKVVDLQKERRYVVTVRSKKYSVVLHTDIEDGGYWIECPSLPGCDSQGDTVEESLEMIKDAIEGHLQVVGEKRRLKKAS